MGRITPAVKFHLHRGANKSTEFRYLLTVFKYKPFGREPNAYRILVPDVFLHPKYWDKQRQRATIDRSAPTFHIKVNALLDELEKNILSIYKDFNAGCILPNELGIELSYRMHWRTRPEIKEKQDINLFSFIDSFLIERETGKHGTEKVLHTWASLLKQFSEERYKRLIDYNDIDTNFFTAFKNWCYASPRNHSINYFAKGLTIGCDPAVMY